MFVKISQEVLNAGLSKLLASAGLTIVLENTTWVIVGKAGDTRPFEVYIGPDTAKNEEETQK